MRDNQRALYVSALAVAMFYVIHETGKVCFGWQSSGELVNLSIDVFMLSLGFAMRSLWPWLYVVGGSLNRLVMDLNGGHMPVIGEAPSSAIHVAANESHRLLLFSDRFRLWGNMFNLGDILIVAGLWGAVWLLGRRVFGTMR